MRRPLTFAVAVVLAAPLLLPVTAQAAIAPNGLIAFSAVDPDTGEHIYTVNPDGTNRTLLTPAVAGEQSAPVWSPDGTRIAFSDVRTDLSGFGSNVWTMDADGGNLVQVTNQTDPDGLGILIINHEPTWSPDGSELLFTTLREGESDLYRVNADGTNPRPFLADEPFQEVGGEQFFGIERDAAWSPTGGTVAFAASLTENSMSLVSDTGTGPITQLDVDGAAAYRSPAWAPDGSLLVYLKKYAGSSTDTIVVADPATGVLTDLNPEGYSDFNDPVFSPDGTQIIVSAYSFETGENGVYSLPVPAPPVAAAKAAAKVAAVAAVPAFVPGTTGALSTSWAREVAGPVCTITGTSRADRIFGTSGDDVICGLGGADWIDGKGGNDILLAGPGRDTVFGGTGDDQLFGGDGRDVLTGGAGVDTFDGGAARDVCVVQRREVTTSC